MMDVDAILQEALDGQPDALARLFHEFEPRLRRMIELRIDSRVQARLAVSDVVQESYLEYAQCLPRYESQADLPFYLWLRTLALRKLLALQRQYLGTAARDVQREVSRPYAAFPSASSMSLSRFFVDSMTSPSQAVARMELQSRLHDVLNDLEETDREILSLRHFEQLSNLEVAQVLQIKPTASSNRYIRALRRIRPLLDEVIPAEDR